MSLKRFSRAGLAALAGAVLVMAAVVSIAHGSTTKTGGVFRLGTSQGIDSLNPYVGFTQQDFEVYGNVYDSLMDYGQLDYKPSPRLATSWSTSPDGLTWTYNIRHGVKWSDGVPLTDGRPPRVGPAAAS